VNSDGSGVSTLHCPERNVRRPALALFERGYQAPPVAINAGRFISALFATLADGDGLALIQRWHALR
jgi:hypothetical protein